MQAGYRSHEVALAPGRNTLLFELKPGSRGVTIQEFTITPVQ